MSLRRNMGYAAGGVGAAVAAALTTGAVVERRVARTRRRALVEADRMGELHSPHRTVACSDGLRLHAEVDEVSPYSSGEADGDELTLLFVHGYALNLDCWHFQRAELRGKHRMVFFDQRSHGRSEHSAREHATIDQLGDDLASVIDTLVPTGSIVLIGHSMGGMAIMALADRHPEVFAERVAGVCLISTSAGGLQPHTLVGRWVPDAVGSLVAPRVVAALANAPELVDSARRPGSNLGYLVTARYAFGGKVPDSEIEFLDRMLGRTSFEVIAEFFPNFTAHDKHHALEQIGAVPTTVIGGTKDRLTPVEHSRAIAEAIPDSRLIECAGAGHMVLFERKRQVNEAIAQLVETVSGSTGSAGSAAGVVS